MGILNQKEYVIIKKHMIMMFFIVSKFLIGLIITSWLLTFTYYFRDKIWDDIVGYFLLPLTLLILNYSFRKLIQWIIIYFNDLVIFINDKIIIVKSSLIDTDDLEIIEISKVMKIDVQCHWFISNLIWWWNLVIELPWASSTQVRTLHYIPHPYKALQLLREKTAYVNTNQDLSFFKLN